MPTPIIVGVGDLKNQTKDLHDDGRDEPASLILTALERAFHDTGLTGQPAAKLRSSVDSIDVVRPWSWPYPDLASLLATRLGLSPERVPHRHVSPHGGNHPAKLLDEACRRVSLGRSKVCVVTGGEALDSLARYMKAGSVPPPGWTEVEGLDVFASNALRPPSEKGVKGVHGVGAPIHVYPLYENGLRAREGKSFDDMHKESVNMYAEFAAVSEANSVSWGYKKHVGGEDIGTVGPKNRMICLPYPLLMNAFNTINLAGACLVTSTDVAEELGIEKAKWVYPLGGAGTAESDEFFHRTNFYSSPAIERSIDAALSVSDLRPSQIDTYDFYSCFPIVPKLACRHLNIPTSKGAKPVTLLGGLTSFGGAGNNYSMHAITEMSRQIRSGQAKNGLILANGGVLSYQHAVCLSNSPRTSPYPDRKPLDDRVGDDVPVPAFDATAEGEAVVETYTVEFNRDGSPGRGHIVGRLKSNGHRFIANHADEATLKELSHTSREVIGRSGWVSKDKEERERNVFALAGQSSKL